MLWALANKWESADICTLSQLRRRERREKQERVKECARGERQDTRRRKKKGSKHMGCTLSLALEGHCCISVCVKRELPSRLQYS